MSKRLFIALQPSIQCSTHHARRYAPQAYLFQSDNPPYPSRRPHTRPFSASTRCAAAGQTRQIKASQGSQPSQPSISVQRSRAMQKAMRDGEIPEDLGVLPQTFIMPFGSKRPGWIANWKGRLKLERARWWARVQDIGSYFMFWGYLRRTNPPPWKTAAIAKELHKEMFANFATGDLQSVETKLCPGMLSSLEQRITQRPRNTSYLWHLHKYVTSPTLVSYKAFPIPETLKWPRGERHGIVQAVVRIHSLQSLQPLKRVMQTEGNKRVVKEFVTDGKGVEWPRERMIENRWLGKGKETVEYVLLQQIYKRTEPGEWKVWGMAEESTLEKIELQKKKKTAEAKKRLGAEKDGEVETKAAV